VRIHFLSTDAGCATNHRGPGRGRGVPLAPRGHGADGLPALAQVEELWPIATLGVRTGVGSPALLTRGVAEAIGAVGPGLSLTFRVFSEQVDAAVRSERIVAGLSGFFGGLALLLAGIGLYGVTSYAVSRRRAEIGVRMALGAEASAVVRLVLARSLRLVAIGLAIGVAASLWASRFVASLLYGLEPADAPTLVAAALTLAAVSLLAAGLPARRAARIDPAEVLREGWPSVFQPAHNAKVREGQGGTPGPRLTRTRSPGSGRQAEAVRARGTVASGVELCRRR